MKIKALGILTVLGMLLLPGPSIGQSQGIYVHMSVCRYACVFTEINNTFRCISTSVNIYRKPQVLTVNSSSSPHRSAAQSPCIAWIPSLPCLRFDTPRQTTTSSHCNPGLTPFSFLISSNTLLQLSSSAPPSAGVEAYLASSTYWLLH